MKNNDQKISQKGFSTLEMLIAMFVLLLSLTAVISVSFGNQSLIIDSQTNAEALNIAQGLLEKAQADARKDFNIVNPVAQTETADGFKYWTEVKQEDGDYFTKLVTAHVEFPEDSGRRGDTELTAVVANFNNAVGGDTCSSVLLPDAAAWKSPEIKNMVTGFDGLAHVSGKFPITDVDAYKGRLYITVGETENEDDPVFFIFDIDKLINDPGHALLGSADNATSTISGLNAVAVAEDPATGNTYAYLANNNDDSQLQVIDVTDPGDIDTGGFADWELKYAGTGKGNSIFYRNGYIYLGLTSAGGDSEFHIIDTHDPLEASGKDVGQWSSNKHDINAIYVRGRYAYLAIPETDSGKNLIILEISNAASPESVGSFSDGGNNGKSLFMAGDALYLGRTLGGTELTVLDVGDPASSTLPIMAGRDDINVSVDGVIVRGATQTADDPELSGLAFLLTKRTFQVYGAAGLVAAAPATATATLSLPNGSDNNKYEASLDCEGNYFFAGSNDYDWNSYISVIAP